MPANSTPLLTSGVTASADIPAYSPVTAAGTQATSGQAIIGFSVASVKSGQRCNLVVGGSAEAWAGGAISFGDLLQVGSNGQVIKAAGGSVIGRAMSSVNSGDKVEVALFQTGVGTQNLLPLTSASWTKQTVIENVGFAAGQTATLIDTTSTPGPGVVNYISIISNTAQGVRDSILSVYVDGESTPSIQFELHCLGTLFQQNTGASTRFFNDHVGCLTNNPSGYQVFHKYPIPYSTSIKITLLSVGATNTWYTQVGNQVGTVLPYRLKTNAIGYATKLTGVTPTQQGNRSVQFLNRPTGKSGWIAGLMYGAFNVSAANDSYLENNIVMYGGDQAQDGSVHPYFESSGTEDFLFNSFYFGNGEGNFKDVFVSSRGRQGNGNTTAVIDLLSAYGGIAYSNGCLFTMERGLAANPGTSTVNIDLVYCTWYYEPA